MLYRSLLLGAMENGLAFLLGRLFEEVRLTSFRDKSDSSNRIISITFIIDFLFDNISRTIIVN